MSVNLYMYVVCMYVVCMYVCVYVCMYVCSKYSAKWLPAPIVPSCGSNAESETPPALSTLWSMGVTAHGGCGAAAADAEAGDGVNGCGHASGAVSQLKMSPFHTLSKPRSLLAQRSTRFAPADITAHTTPHHTASSSEVSAKARSDKHHTNGGQHNTLLSARSSV
jgi:hypothetical protein